MRLKTKFQDEDFDIGEVVEANVYYGGSGRIKVIAEPAKGGMITFYFETLKGMNEMFEDATEEPEEWYINEYNEPEKVDFGSPIDDIESLREIGFLFKTEKETELAIRKCKAWKRLRDKGFRFDGWEDLQAEMSMDDLMLFNRDVLNTDNIIGFRMDDYHDCIKDLNICFGGEE